jgi:uncharacterized repeat protein (TIGR02543 family)
MTVASEGFGQVTVNPRANVYAQNSSVTLSAIPDAGQTFLGWSGDATGTSNPLLIVTTAQSETITANFSRRPQLAVDTGLDGKTPEGFRFTLTGEAGVYRIEESTNLSNWGQLALITNAFGKTQLTDPTTADINRRFYRAVVAP